MKKMIITICSLICVFMVTTMQVYATSALNTVTVKVFQDTSYLSMYSNQPTYINTTMSNVGYPFKNKWNIQISPSYYNITGMPLEACPNGNNTICNTLNCGETCVNQNTTPNHHKNFDRNCLFAKDSYGYNGWDLALTISSATLCHQHGDNHDTCGLGMVPFVGSDFAMAKLTTSRGNPGNVRVIQHELSHNFGCYDNQCTPGEACIMSGGFDMNSTYDLTNIWCTNCTSTFNRTKH